MADPTRIAQRQLDLGPAGFFRPEALSPASNQIRVKAGVVFTGGCDLFSVADQLTAGFPVVAIGFERYDLVYINAALGTALIASGTPVAAASPFLQGAPGQSGGPSLPDNAIPVAYVFVDETASVTVDDVDITPVQGFLSGGRDLGGYFVDKGLLGGAPAGASDIVTGLFGGETPGGSDSQAGVITSPPLNVVHLLDQKKDEIKHTTGARIYGRITEAASVWTLSYFYIDALGVETAIATIETENDQGAGLTDLQLVGTPKVFCRNDPARPLFASPLQNISDQVVGDIPDATTAVKGKVLISADGVDTAAPAVPAADDSRLGRIRVDKNTSGSPVALRRILNIIEGPNLVATLADAGAGPDRTDLTLSATGIGAPVTAAIYESELVPLISITQGAAGPTPLADGPVTIPASTLTSVAIITFEAMIRHAPGFNFISSGAEFELAVEYDNGVGFVEPTFQLRVHGRSFAPNNFQIGHGGTYSRTIILSVAKGNFIPGNALTVRWKEFRRLNAIVPEVEAEERVIRVYGW